MLNQDQFSYLQCNEDTLKKFDIQVKSKQELINLVNEQFSRKLSKTSKEKFETLLLRDKFLKLIRYEIHSNLQEQSHIVLSGSCMDMCPEKERYSREYLNLYHKYEVNQATKQPDHYLMIKEYSRSSADQDLPLPNEMRPLPVLFDTMLFIIDEIISKIETFTNSDLETESEFSVCEWYDFVWNRTRSIRKDIIQQRLLLNDNKNSSELIHYENHFIQSGLGGVLIIEQCARFHIMCSHRLCDQPSEVFDFKINEENLKNCFQSLRQYYENAGETKSLEQSPNEAEFRSYIILLNLNETNILCEIQRWPKHIRYSKQVRFALNVYFAYQSHNYVKFFRLVQSEECEYLQACILHRYFFKVRTDAFKIIFSSFRENKEKQYPITELAELLSFDNLEDLYEYCNLFQLDIVDDTHIRLRQSTDCFNVSSNELKFKRSHILVENKFYFKLKSYEPEISNEDCLSVIISGLTIDEVKQCRFLDDYELENSFDNEGRFISDEVVKYLNEAQKILSTREHMIDRVPKQVLKPKPVNLVVKAANEIKKKTLERRKSVLNESGQLKRERKKSASSNSSASSVETKVEEESMAKKPSFLFKNITKEAETTQSTTQKNLFSLIAKPKPLFDLQQQQQQQQQQKQQPTETQNLFQQTFQRSQTNLFENIIKKQEVLKPIVQQQQQQLPPQIDHLKILKEKLINEYPLTIYESIFDEITKSFVSNFITNLGQISQDMCSYIIDYTIKQELSQMIQNEIDFIYKSRAKNELITYIAEQIYDGLLANVVQSICIDFLHTQLELEKLVYEEILCNVFQSEFSIILKQIANEINKELVLDRLAESIYFSEDEPSQSLFNQDLVSFLHSSIYEFTRLNLNVNRELYYEIKQASNLNQQSYLFRKWRLKLSQKLLNREHRRASLGLKQQQQLQQQQNESNISLNRELYSINFMSNYANYLVQNLSKTHKLKYYLTPQKCFNLVHCDQFQLHLSTNLSINLNYYIYEFLIDNYFSIIHNRDSDIIMNIPETNLHKEINIKTVIYFMSNTSTIDYSSIIQKQLIGIDCMTKKYKLVNVYVNMLNRDEFGFKLCVRLGENEFDLRGANSVIFVLDSLNENFDSYMAKLRAKFKKLFSNLDYKNFRFLFISHLDIHMTEKCAQILLNNSASYDYCLLENDETTSELRNLQSIEKSYENFLHKLIIDEKTNINHRPQLTILNLYELIYMTLIKYLDYLTQNSVYIELNIFISEFNERLSKLISLITMTSLRDVNWPMPELVDELEDETKWSLKYWNLKECFQLIQHDFYNLIKLEDERDSFENDDYIEFSLVEEMILKYINKLLKLKNIQVNLDCHLMNKIELLIENMKKFSIKKNNLFNTSDESDEKRTKFYLSKSNINWSIFIRPFVEYLITNSRLNLNDRNLSLDQFYIYVDYEAIKSVDWIDKDDLIRKYVKKNLYLSGSNLKRRFSVDNLTLSTCSQVASTPQKIEIKPKRLMTSQLVKLEPNEEGLKDLNVNFEKFMNFFHKEKENSKNFDNRLNKLANDEYDIMSVNNVDGLKSMNDEDTMSKRKETFVNSNDDLDNLLKKLHEEKIKSKQFNDKLNRMLL